MSRAARRRSTATYRLRNALDDAGLESLAFSVFPAGVVVDDGDTLWTARPSDLIRAAKRVAKELVDIKRREADRDEQGVRAYDRLCSLAPYLARQRGEPAQRAHRRTVKAWQRQTGALGNWA